MAKTNGSQAFASIFQTCGAWWNALYDGFSSKKNNGRWSWALICTAMVNILGFLVISPLSSSLLVSQQVAVHKEGQFSRLAFRNDTPLAWNIDREVYFRTIGHLLQNVSTSAWVTDSFMALPFWPSADQANPPLGVTFSTTDQTWYGETTLLSTELQCEKFDLIQTGTSLQSFSIVDNVQTPYITLSTSDGCMYSLNLFSSYGMVLQGGGFWTNINSFMTSSYVGGYQGGVSSESAFADAQSDLYHVNYTQQCGNREAFIVSTAWLPNDPTDGGGSKVFNVPLNYEFLSNFTLNAHLCSASYYMASIPVTATLSSSSVSLSFDEDKYRNERAQIPNDILNTSEFQNVVLSGNWAAYFTAPENSWRPSLSGLTVMLGALEGWSLETMTVNPDLVTRGQMVRQRLLSEALLSSVTEQGAMSTENFIAQVSAVEERIVVTLGVAVALSVILFVSFLLLLAICWCTRPVARPLNLNHDPASVTVAAELLTQDQNTHTILNEVDDLQRKMMMQALETRSFRVTSHTLHETGRTGGITKESREQQVALSSEKSPIIIRLWAQVALPLCLVLFLIAILILYTFAERSQIRGTFFTYEANIHIFKTSINLFSIIPTLFAVGLGLWWASLESILRRAQPYLSMIKAPTRVSQGVSLSYQSSYLMWAAVRAALNGHWLLCLTAVGATLSQILTISTSALFNLSLSDYNKTQETKPILQLRSGPLQWAGSYYYEEYGTDSYLESELLSSLYSGYASNWLYTATIQLARNGTQPAWSRDGWNFVPMDFASVTVPSQSSVRIDNRNDNAATSSSSTMNVTVTTPALRGRIECNVVEGLSNLSAWLTDWDLTKSTFWNTTLNPTGYSQGYELGLTLGNSNDGQQLSMINIPDYRSDTGDIFTYNTSIYALPVRMDCCGNSDNMIGFWSPNSPAINGYSYSYWNFQTFPANFTVKWVHAPGPALTYYENNDTIFSHWIHVQQPSMQALNCVPLVEKATAEVTLDYASGEVYSFTILDEPVPVPEAWQHKMDEPWTIGAGRIASGNVSISYGVLFQAALLASTNLNHLSGSVYGWGSVDSGDQTFNIRDEIQKLNVDFMTYSMHSLAGQDPIALLNATLLQELAEQTFSTFFQHYVSNNISMQDGGWAYQAINATGPTYLPTKRDSVGSKNIAIISMRTEILKMNAAAVWISVVILVWLIITAIFVPILERKNFEALVRDVDCLAIALVLITSSENFLELLRTRGVDSLLHDKSALKTKLGWFRGVDGKVRWGIELAEGAGGELLRDDESRDQRKRTKWLSSAPGQEPVPEMSGVVHQP